MTKHRKFFWGKGIILAVLLLVLAYGTATGRLEGWLDAFINWTSSRGWGGMLCFFVFYCLAPFFFIPLTVLTLASGLLFGFWTGIILVSIASTLSAVLTFLAGRYLIRDWVIRKTRDKPRYKALDQAVGREGWKIVAMSRLTFIFPFSLLNYFFGSTGVTLRAYTAASWAAMLPGSILYVYLGTLAGTLAGLGETRSRVDWVDWTLLAIALAAGIGLAVYSIQLARRAFRSEAGSGSLS